jgi:hypothetical protein
MSMAENSYTSGVYQLLRMAAYSESARIAEHIDERWAQMLEAILFDTVPTFTDDELQRSLRSSIESEASQPSAQVNQKNKALATILRIIEAHEQHKQPEEPEDQ